MSFKSATQVMQLVITFISLLRFSVNAVALLCSSVTEHPDGVTVTQHEQHQSLETEAAEWNLAIIPYLSTTHVLFTALCMNKQPLWFYVSLLSEILQRTHKA